MAYYSGVANDMAAVRQALIDACVGEGWSWSASTELLSKSGVLLKITFTSNHLNIQGGTSELGINSPSPVRIGGPLAGQSLDWPLRYMVHVFPQEVYLIINYNVNYYQWLAFGKSTVSLPGTGMWFAGSLEQYSNSLISMSESYGNSSDAQVTPALFWSTNAEATRNRTWWLHSDLDDQGWMVSQVGTYRVGADAFTELLRCSPSAWNSEASLLPIRAYKVRPEKKISLIADLRNARYVRVDNINPEQIITLGSERWKVYPFYLKNTASRNGGNYINHSGTFGWAIRYDGP